RLRIVLAGELENLGLADARLPQLVDLSLGEVFEVTHELSRQLQRHLAQEPDAVADPADRTPLVRAVRRAAGASVLAGPRSAAEAIGLDTDFAQVPRIRRAGPHRVHDRHITPDGASGSVHGI